MNDYFEKKYERIEKRIYSNIDSPYTFRDRLKHIKKIVKKICVYILGTANLDDENNKKVLEMLFSQEQSLRIILNNLKPELINAPILETTILNNTFESYLSFPIRKIRTYIRYYLRKVTYFIKIRFNLQCIGNSLIVLNNLGIVCVNKNQKTFYLTEMAKKIFFIDSEKQLSEEELNRLFEWTLDIGDKQYRAYDWNDNKVQCLLTVDAALMAGVIFVLQLLGDNSIKISSISLGIFALSFLFLVISLIVCLIHSIPILNSKLGDGHNLRTIVGIESFARYEAFFNQTKNHERRYNATNKYYESLSNLNLLDMVHMNAWQIVGMSRNNVTSNKYIRKGVISTILGVITLMIGVGVMAIENII